jgi:hypothetical protein
MVAKEALGQGFLLSPLFSPASVISPVFHAHACISQFNSNLSHLVATVRYNAVNDRAPEFVISKTFPFVFTVCPV